jgi:hypothetical protein
MLEGGKPKQADVCFGSKADMSRRNRHVRFTPESGHVRCSEGCPLWANSGHVSDAISARIFSSSK